MMKKALLSCCAIWLFQASFAQVQLPEAFVELLSRAKMTFTIPEGYLETEVVTNPHMLYDFAVKHPTAKFEIRYTVRPMDKLIRHYEEKIASGATMAHPNKYLPAATAAIILNIAANQPSGQPFDKDAVQEEFNADFGTTGFCAVKEKFGNGYKYCTMVSIFKEDRGAGYIFYMADDLETFTEQMPPVFHALKFE